VVRWVLDQEHERGPPKTMGRGTQELAMLFSNHMDNHRYTPPGGRVYLPVPATLPKIPVSDEGSRLPSS
jgi:hypothetical protein